MTRPSTGTVFVLFTDIVSSTELLEQIGDEAMDQVRREHFQLLREAVNASAGEIVKTMGDGMMVTFSSAIDAIGCAVAMQEAVANYNDQPGVHPVQMRVGLHAGEIVKEGDDYFGTPVVIAKRLCDLAGPGQILASDLVRALVGNRGSFQFRDTGEVSLKGIALPLPSKEIVWGASALAAAQARAAPASSQSAVPVPAAGAPPPSTAAQPGAAGGPKRSVPAVALAAAGVVLVVGAVVVGVLVLGGGGGSESSATSGQSGTRAVPGSTVVEDAQGDFNARACNPAQANQPCSAPANAVAITAPYLDIKTAKITQPSPRQIEFTIVLYGAPPRTPPYPYLGYFWQFSGGCLGGATGATKKDALGVTWNGREWTGAWSQIVSCNPLTGAPGDAINFTISGDTISVRVPLDDLITRSGESIEWFAGVRLIAPSQTFPNTISLDLAPDVNAINPNPPPFFLRPQSPATWVNK